MTDNIVLYLGEIVGGVPGFITIVFAAIIGSVSGSYFTRERDKRIKKANDKKEALDRFKNYFMLLNNMRLISSGLTGTIIMGIKKEQSKELLEEEANMLIMQSNSLQSEFSWLSSFHFQNYEKNWSKILSLESELNKLRRVLTKFNDKTMDMNEELQKLNDLDDKFQKKCKLFIDLIFIEALKLKEPNNTSTQELDDMILKHHLLCISLKYK